jgi:UDP-N-acetylglucosamine enolpyruvyl transferase
MSNQAFRVQGNAHLSGSIQPQGAKNEALQIVSAVLLTDKKVTIKNIPDILDIQKQIELLKGLGVKVEKIKIQTTIHFRQMTSILITYRHPNIRKMQRG